MSKYLVKFQDGSEFPTDDKLAAVQEIIRRGRLYFPHIYGSGHMEDSIGRKFWATIEDFNLGVEPHATLYYCP